MLTEVGREELAQYPQMEQTRTRLLTKARSFYDQLLTQRPTDEALRFEWAIALRNLDAAQLIARCIAIVRDPEANAVDETTDELVSTYKARLRDVLQLSHENGFRDSEKVENALQESGALFTLRNDTSITEILEQIRNPK